MNAFVIGGRSHRLAGWLQRALLIYLVYQKNEPLFVKNFLGHNETEFIKILHAVTSGYYQHFYKVSKRSVANYVSIVKLNTTSQKMQYQSKIMLSKSSVQRMTNDLKLKPFKIIRISRRDQILERKEKLVVVT